MNNEKGLTLVELLVSIVIVGFILVPLLTVMTGTFTRTVSQDKETKIAYIGQEVIEKVMNHRNPLSIGEYCWSNLADPCNGYTALPAPYNEIVTNEDVVVTVKVVDYTSVTGFNEVTVTATNESWISNGGSNLQEKENKIELVTVVRE